MVELTTMKVVQPLLLAVLSTVSRGLWFPCNCGRVEPRDPYVFFNDTVVLNCTLKTDALNSSDLYFIKTNPDTTGNRIPSEIIDDKTIMLKKIARPGDEGPYYCYKLSYNSSDIVDGQIVKLEYKPPKLQDEDLTCILYNWGEKMECSFDLPFLSMRHINVTFQWRNLHRIYFAECPRLTVGKTTVCTWPLSSRYSLGADLTWHFRILITNTRRNVPVESILEKEILKFVKPNTVTEFSVSLTNGSHCVVLSWNYDRYSRHQPQFARIRHVSKRSSVVNKQRTKNNYDNVTICSLFPYTEYTFTIDVKPAEGGYWSDPEVKTFTTDEDVPTAAPEMRPGYYERSSDECKIKNAQHPTRVFWKQIPEEKRNGIITGYNIILRNVNTNFVNEIRVNGEQENSKSLLLNCSNWYNVTIRARTKKGVSLHASSILIPDRYNTDLILPKVIVEIADNKTQESLNVFNVSWTVQPKEAKSTIHGFSVHYCRGSTGGTCQEELQSVNVSAEKRWLLLRNLDGFYLIGVSMEYAKFSSGLSFTSCVYKKDQVPAVPGNVEVHTQMENTLSVTWMPTKCNSDNPYVFKYTIYWCKVTDQKCNEPMESHEVLSSDLPSYDITNLEKGQKYGVQVTAHSYYQVSQQSEMIIEIPKNSDLDAGQITGISFAAIVVLVLCVICLVFCIRANYQTLFKELPIEVPPVETRNAYNQDSKESGLGSMKENDQRSSPPSPQSSKYILPINDEKIVAGDKNGYQSLSNPYDQSHDQPKDSSEKTKNSLICIPSSGYEGTASPDIGRNNENSVKFGQSEAGYFRPKPFYNTEHGPMETRSSIVSSTDGSVSDYVKEENPRNTSNCESSDYVLDINVMMPHDTSSGTLPDYALTSEDEEPPILSNSMHSGYVKNIEAMVPPETSRGTPLVYTRNTTAEESNNMHSDYVKDMKAMPPSTSSDSISDYARTIRDEEPRIVPNDIHTGYVKDIKAMVPPNTSNDTPSDYVSSLGTTLSPNKSSGVPSDYVSALLATIPPDILSGAPSDYVRETIAGKPLTMATDISSDYVKDIKAMMTPVLANNGQDTSADSVDGSSDI